MKRILVAMDLSDADYRLLDYIRFIGEELKPEKVYFTHVSPGLEVPAFAQHWYDQENIKPLDERIRESMSREIKLKLKPGLVDYEMDVLEGNTTDQLLHWSKVKSCDLIVVGKKERHLGSGLSSRRLLHKTEASVLFIPENTHPRIQHILVPTDFSAHSTYALERAINLALRTHPTPVITLLNVYEVPSGLHYQISRTREQFAGMVRENVAEYAKGYLDKLDQKGIKVQLELVENTEFNAAFHIADFARKKNVDFIMIGAKGHSAVERILLGSVTERMLSYEYATPLYVIRPQGTLNTISSTDTLYRSSS